MQIVYIDLHFSWKEFMTIYDKVTFCNCLAYQLGYCGIRIKLHIYEKHVYIRLFTEYIHICSFDHQCKSWNPFGHELCGVISVLL